MSGIGYIGVFNASSIIDQVNEAVNTTSSKIRGDLVDLENYAPAGGIGSFDKVLADELRLTLLNNNRLLYGYTSGDIVGDVREATVSSPLSFSSGVLSIPAASGSVAGHVTTGAQTFAGDKTFNGTIIAGNATLTSASLGVVATSNGTVIFHSAGASATLTAQTFGSARTITLPDATGTVSLVGHAHAISDVTNLQTSLNGKEGTITAGTTAQYWRGDKTWQTLNNSAVGLGNVGNFTVNQNVGTADSPTFAGLTLTGDVAVNGGDITSTATTFNLLNNTVTTLNIGGAATAITLGMTSGTATIRNATVNFSNATAIQVGGTTIVDGSRNLSNLAKVTASTAVANAPTISATLSGGTTNTEYEVLRLDVTGSGAQLPALILRSNSTAGMKISHAAAFETGVIDHSFASATAVSFRIRGSEAATYNNSLNWTFAGDIAVNGGDLTSTQTTFNLLNATVTTLNIGGAATAITLGMTSGTATIRNATVNFSNATAIQVGGTTIIDGSRNLSNIGTITSGAITSSGVVTGASLASNLPAGNVRDVVFFSSSVARWIIRVDSDAESGGDTGSSFRINSRTDAGAGKTTVLSLDRATGAATFASTLSSGAITSSGNVAVNGGSLTTTQTTANLFNATVTTLNIGGAATTIAIGGGGTTTLRGNLVPHLTDTYDLGSSTNLWRRGYLSELDAVLFAKNTITLLGGWLYVTPNAGVVNEHVTNVDTSINLGVAGIATGSFIIFRAAGAVEYMKVLGLVGGETTIYNVERDRDGSGANVWVEGTPFAVLGTEGQGRIELNAYDTPRMSVLKQGATYNAQTEILRIGDLNGLAGFASAKYGFYLSDGADAVFYVADDGTAKIAGWDISGTTLSSGGISLVSSATTADNKIFVGVGTYANSNTPFYVGGDGKFSLKDKLTWDGSLLTVSGAIQATSGWIQGTLHVGTGVSDRILLDGSNKLLRSENYVADTTGWAIKGDGSLDFRSGVVGGFTIGATSLTATNFALNPSAGTLVLGAPLGQRVIFNTSGKIDFYSSNNLLAGSLSGFFDQSGSLIVESQITTQNLILAAQSLPSLIFDTGGNVMALEWDGSGLAFLHVQGSTNALILSGGGATFAGTLASGAITSTGTITLPNTNTLTGRANDVLFGKGVAVATYVDIAGNLQNDAVYYPVITKSGGSETGVTFTITIRRFDNNTISGAAHVIHWWFSTAALSGTATPSMIAGTQTVTAPTSGKGTNLTTYSATALNRAVTNTSSVYEIAVQNSHAGAMATLHLHVEVQGRVYSSSHALNTSGTV